MEPDNKERRDRIKYLRMQEERKNRLPMYLSFLSKVSNELITEKDVLSIEEAEDVWEKIYGNKKYQQAVLSISFPYGKKDNLTKVFNALTSSLAGSKQYFSTDRFHNTCLLFIDTSFCVNTYENLIGEIGDAFSIYDDGLNNCVEMDALDEDQRGKGEHRWTYELTVQGIDWIDKVYDAYREVERVG